MESRCSLKSIKGRKMSCETVCVEIKKVNSGMVLGKWCVRPYVRLMQFPNWIKDLYLSMT